VEKKNNVIRTWPLLVITIVVITCFSILIVYNFLIGRLAPSYVIAAPAIEFVQSASSSVQENTGAPVRLNIPDINVNAFVESVGLTALGAVGVPEGPVDVAWYDMGTRPGAIGSAVIVGHEGWKDGIAAVFDNLNKLVLGEKIYLTDNTGTTTVFIVRHIRLYGEHDSVPAVFNSTDGLAHLNLITCEGIWNAAKESYSGRLVVFTDKE
jgi:sortase A